MRFTSRFCSHLWIVLLLLALTFWSWSNVARLERVDYVSGLGEWSVDPPQVDPRSPTGYAGGRRQLIGLEHLNDSYEWIVQTQAAVGGRGWRLRHVDYDNAPFGRESHLPLAYRGWLALVAWCEHVVGDLPLALSVERAARWADPLLQLLLVVSATVVLLWKVGRFAAAVFAIASVTLFPWASGFLAAAPDHRALGQFCAVWSVLPILIGARGARRRGENGAVATGDAEARRWFAGGAAFGAIGLWVNFDYQWPILAGIALGAGWDAWCARAKAATAADAGHTRLPWAWWGMVGCLVSLSAYMVEYFPAHIRLRLQGNHPLYAIEWLLVGLLLGRIARPRASANLRSWRSHIALAGIAIAVAAVPFGIAVKGARGVLAEDPAAGRLTAINGGIAAPSFRAWLARDGITTTTGATVLPLLIVLPAAWALRRNNGAPENRSALRVGLGALAAAVTFAAFQLRGWNFADGVALALLAVVLPSGGEMPNAPRPCWAWSIGVAAAIGVALIPLWPAVAPADGKFILTQVEAQSLIERDLGHWLSRRAKGRAVVLAPPDLTASLYFHGNLKGICTLDPENRDGVGAAIRIASAISDAEALELVTRREITHLVIPSWDRSLEQFARMGTGAFEQSFVSVLQNWNLPRWVQPVPYATPNTPGLEHHTVIVFEIVDPQGAVVALGRLAEYFLEMRMVENAAGLRARLRQYPSDISSLVALGHVAAAMGDIAESEHVLKALDGALRSGLDRALPWDRRVSLATFLAHGRRLDLAREQARRCARDATDERLRRLSTAALYRFRILQKIAGVEFPDAQMAALEAELLPADLRERIRAR